MLTRKQGVMDFELFKQILDDIINETNQYKVLTFPGMGEPLLDSTLNKKINYAKSLGFSILILTNGSLLTPDRFKQLEDLGVESIRVSFYASHPIAYADVHGVSAGKFYIVRDNLLKICNIKSSTKLLMTYNQIEGYNGSTTSEWIEYWGDKVDLLEVWRPHNWAGGGRYRPIQNKKLRTCGRPCNTPLQIQVDGTVNMCCFDYDGQLYLGDLKTQSLKEIFDSEEYLKILSAHGSGIFEDSGLICEHCDQRNADKSDIMIYNSKLDMQARVNQLSTTYKDVICN
jgi:hypothetical protein